MKGKDYMIVTNNPLVLEKFGAAHKVIYLDVSYEGILREVRDRIHGGHLMLTHPLSGSVKPNETPYKSIMLSEERGETDPESIILIENAIQACGKFKDRTGRYRPEVYEDFRIVDCTLISSAVESADAMYGMS